MSDIVPVGSRQRNRGPGPALDRGSNVPLATIGLVLGMLLSVLDQAVVVIALPDITADLGSSDFSWIVTAYVLGSTATGAFYGRISDRYGRREVFLIAIAVFTISSLLCGMAQSMPQLITARTVQGLGAGALFVIPTVSLSELYPEDLRSKVQGLTAVVFVLASVGGPLVGGAITDAFGWRWIFYINIPIGLLSAVLCAVALRLPRAGGTERVDYVGAVLLIAAVVSLLLLTEWGGRRYEWSSAPLVGLAVAGLVLFTTFVRWEKRVASPLLPMRLFTDPALRLVLLSTALLGMLLYGSAVFMPTLLQAAYGWSATRAGLALTPYFLPFVVVSAIAGGRAGKTGQLKPYLVSGAVLLVCGFVLLTAVDPDAGYLRAASAMVVLGAGFGLLMQNLVVASQNAAAPSDLAASTAANLSVRGLGMAIGVALFGNLLTREIGDAPASPEATATAIAEVFVWGVPLAALLALFLVLTPRNRSGAKGESFARQPR